MTAPAWSQTSETWLPVVRVDGYLISDAGRVLSLRRPEPRLLATTISGGYPALHLGCGRTWPVHHLVAEAFLGPRPQGHEIRHLDGNPLNNSASNLAYGTPSQNALDRVQHGRDHNSVKTHCPQDHPYNEINTYRDGLGRRRCRACRAAGMRRANAAKRGAA